MNSFDVASALIITAARCESTPVDWTAVVDSFCLIQDWFRCGPVVLVVVAGMIRLMVAVVDGTFCCLQIYGESYSSYLGN